MGIDVYVPTERLTIGSSCAGPYHSLHRYLLYAYHRTSAKSPIVMRRIDRSTGSSNIPVSTSSTPPMLSRGGRYVSMYVFNFLMLMLVLTQWVLTAYETYEHHDDCDNQ